MSDEDYIEFFLSSKASVAELDCLEISHTNFSQTYYLVRNAKDGVTVTHEDGTTHAYTYAPMRCSLSGPRDDMDHILTVQLGDVGKIAAKELRAIEAASGFSELPRVVYRTYRSDVLTSVLYGPLRLEVLKFNLDPRGTIFEAKAPSLNVQRTGERYNVARFPGLRGLL